MRSLDSWFDEYGESHQNPVNKAIHWICVPVIFFSILVMLTAIPHQNISHLFGSDYFHWGTIAALALLIFYFAHSWVMGLAMTIFCSLCFGLLMIISNFSISLWGVGFTLFVVAWIGQFYGHHLEGKKPSFFKDIQFLLIGPAWLMGFVLRRLQIRY